MSFNKKSTVVVAALALALSTSLTGCFGSSDTSKVTDAAKDTAAKTTDAAGKAADGAKDAAGKAVDGAKDAAGKAVDGAKDAAGKAAGAATGGGLAKLVSEAKAPLVAVNSAVKGGDMKKAKTAFEKFDGVWSTVSPQIKPLAGDKFAALEKGVEGIKAAVTSGDKTKALAALEPVLKSMNAMSVVKK